eukprot:6276526-Pyramimonas_sp.AAC.1
MNRTHRVKTISPRLCSSNRLHVTLMCAPGTPIDFKLAPAEPEPLPAMVLETGMDRLSVRACKEVGSHLSSLHIRHGHSIPKGSLICAHARFTHLSYLALVGA